MLDIDLHDLDTRPAMPCGVTGGVPWPRGELAVGEPVRLCRACSIARTSPPTLWAMPTGTTPGDRCSRGEQMIRPPPLTCDPAHHHAWRVFGPP